MKPTKRTDLVAGKVYADVEEEALITLLEFIRYTETECLFKCVGGIVDSYLRRDEDDLISFSINVNDYFYEVEGVSKTESE